ncbi:MAG: zinc-dependent alcohol dehydrogenase [Acidimicrobiales bacterium]
MRAVMVTGPDAVVVDTIPPPAPDERAHVALERMGVCGSDLKIVRGQVRVHYPRVLGHELVGRVVRAGARGLVAEGTRVLVNPSLACGVCRECRRDRTNVCPNGGLMGRDVDGGFAELVAVDEDRLLPVPDDLAPEAASLLQVLGTCVHAQATASVLPGDTAVVIGLGVSGFLTLQLLAARGARVVGVTRAEWKRELGERLGAAAVVPPMEAAGVLHELTAGAGADVVVEAVGSVATLAHGIELAGYGATIVQFGTIAAAGEGALPLYELYRKELTVRNPRAALHRDYGRAVALASTGAVTLEPLWTHGFPLDRAGEAFELFERDPRALKVTLDVKGAAAS